MSRRTERTIDGGLRTARLPKACPKTRRHWAWVRRLGRRVRRRRERRAWMRELARDLPV